MLQKLRANKLSISRRRNRADLKTIFVGKAIIEALQFIKNIEVGKKPARDANKNNSWDIERLDQSANEEDRMLEDKKS